MSRITFDKAKFRVGLRDNVVNMLGKIEPSVKSNTKVYVYLSGSRESTTLWKCSSSAQSSRQSDLPQGVGFPLARINRWNSGLPEYLVLADLQRVSIYHPGCQPPSLAKSEDRKPKG
ncbi:hypothetical protein AVEN_41264-1 [Araneus ventricosus]|uniref:Uncharacterized protein n=1 Tax=Araneus ventricosus TaxID=182803 RepID=A0A4Y2TMK9_ARAVE|nr:hypothetical protein AVEN_41264-1 [Araneus ventricosus]